MTSCHYWQKKVGGLCPPSQKVGGQLHPLPPSPFPIGPSDTFLSLKLKFLLDVCVIISYTYEYMSINTYRKLLCMINKHDISNTTHFIDLFF